MKKKYIIMTPSYNENSGGIVVLHKLCDQLNKLGFEAYVIPYRYSYYFSRYNFFSECFNFLKWSVRNWFKPFKINQSFITPIFPKFKPITDEYIVVYPEVVFGNPLRAKNVVRWLLHQPGYHEGVFYYSTGELIYKFNSAINDFVYPGSYTSKNFLKVIHYPTDIYCPPLNDEPRSGTAYCIRKGKGKTFVKDHKRDILIDHLDHNQIADVFKKSMYFISYDEYTAYSIFAVLCGCISIVIPSEGIDIENWYPNKEDRYGIAYGLKDLDRAKSTANLVKEHISNEEKKSTDRVLTFATESQLFFENPEVGR